MVQITPVIPRPASFCKLGNLWKVIPLSTRGHTVPMSYQQLGEHVKMSTTLSLKYFTSFDKRSLPWMVGYQISTNFLLFVNRIILVFLWLTDWHDSLIISRDSCIRLQTVHVEKRIVTTTNGDFAYGEAYSSSRKKLWVSVNITKFYNYTLTIWH